MTLTDWTNIFVIAQSLAVVIGGIIAILGYFHLMRTIDENKKQLVQTAAKVDKSARKRDVHLVLCGVVMTVLLSGACCLSIRSYCLMLFGKKNT